MDVQDLMDKAGRLPRMQRVGAMVFIYVIVVVAFWFVLYSPKQDELAGLESTRKELQTKKAEVQRRAEDKEAFEKELEDLTAQLKQALRQLPDRREIDDLLSRISTVGRRIGLEIRKFYPKEEVVKEYHAEVPVQLEVAGDYHQVAMFFDRLSKLSRIVYVQDVTMGDPKEQGGKVQLTVEGTLTTFRFLSEEERKKHIEEQQAAAKGGRRGRKE